MGVYRIFLFCIVLSCGSWKIPFLDYDFQSIAGATADSLGNSGALEKILKWYNLKQSEDMQEESFKKWLRPSSSINRIELGKLGELRKTRIARSVSGTQDLSRFVINPFRDPSIRYVRLYRFWQPCFVSETLNSENWIGSEARVEFKPSLRSLQNITKASLNVTVNTDDNSSKLPILLYGSFSPFSTLTNATTRSPTEFVSLGHVSVPQINSTGTAKVSFQITEFIRQASVRDDQTSLKASQKVLIVFLVRRQCNSTNSSECSFIINSDFDMPYLKVNY